MERLLLTTGILEVSDFARETQPALGSSWVTCVSPLLPTPSQEPHPV